jgi:hypothetical protein
MVAVKSWGNKLAEELAGLNKRDGPIILAEDDMPNPPPNQLTSVVSM